MRVKGNETCISLGLDPDKDKGIKLKGSLEDVIYKEAFERWHWHYTGFSLFANPFFFLKYISVSESFQVASFWTVINVRFEGQLPKDQHYPGSLMSLSKISSYLCRNNSLVRVQKGGIDMEGLGGD